MEMDLFVYAPEMYMQYSHNETCARGMLRKSPLPIQLSSVYQTSFLYQPHPPVSQSLIISICKLDRTLPFSQLSHNNLVLSFLVIFLVHQQSVPVVGMQPSLLEGSCQTSSTCGRNDPGTLHCL